MIVDAVFIERDFLFQQHLTWLIVNEPIGRATLEQLSRPSVSHAADIINKPHRARTIGAVFLSLTRKFPADRARRPLQKASD